MFVFKNLGKILIFEVEKYWFLYWFPFEINITKLILIEINIGCSGGFRGSILEIRLGAMDFGDRSLKVSLTMGLGDRSLKSGLGPWISGTDPWNFPLPWIWGLDHWNQAWGHGFRGSILEIFPYPGFGGSRILEIRLGAMDFGDRSLKFSLTLDLGDRSLKSGLGPWISGIDPWNLPLPWIWGNDPWDQAWGHGFRGSILEIYPPGFGGSILEIRLGAMDLGDRSLKFSLTLDLGERSLKSGLGPWISGIDPWNFPLPWIWGIDPWNQAWGHRFGGSILEIFAYPRGHGFRGSILEIFPYPGFGGSILEIRLGAMDLVDRSLKVTLTLDLGDRSLKLGLGQWIWGIDPWNLPLPWIWGIDP